jgi:hypothetical protein
MAILLSALFAQSEGAEARSPVPFFLGVEHLVLFCGRPTVADQREKLCAVAQETLQALTGAPVPIGTAGLSDTAAITVLVNGYPIEGPNGPVLAIDIGMLRKGQTDGQLFGAPPVLVAADALTTGSPDVVAGLRTQFSQRIVEPWRLAVPHRQNGPAGKKG